MRARRSEAAIVAAGVLVFAALWAIVQPDERADRAGTDAQIGGPHAKTHINVTSPADVQRVRARLQRLVWGATAVPNDVRARLEPATDPPVGIRGARAVQRIVIGLPLGFRSLGMLVRTARSRPRGLVVWHDSHERNVGESRVIQRFARAGYDVAVLSMPLYGANRSRLVRDAAGVLIRPRTHHDLMRLEQPLRFFLDPVAGVVNTFAARYRFIALGGVGGGGWTATVYGAIDPRIDAVYPVAGSLPLDLRHTRPADWGDDEQRFPPLFSLASYEDLYVLGSTQRRQLAIWNRFDSCCFAGGRERSFAAAVRAAAMGLGGTFAAYSDSSGHGHTVSRQAQLRILRDMNLGLAEPAAG